MAEKNGLVADSCLEDQSSTTPSPSSSTHSKPSTPHHDELYHSLFHETGMPSQNPKKAKKSPQSDHPPSLPTLPHQIIAEIFSRLPVKALIKFRCVSKTFKTLFSDPQFINAHLRKITSSSEKKPNRYQKIVLTYSGPPSSRHKSCSLYSIYNNLQTDAIEIGHFLLKDKYRYDWLVGSCDGLLCVAAKQNYVALWNPSTRVADRLPGLGFGKKLGSYTVFGFGYDSEIDDYKVVAVFCFQNRGGNGGIGYETRVEVCTLWTKYWRRIEGFRYGVPCDVSGKYVNGSLIWPVMCERDSGLAWIIVSFDLAKETYKEMVQPDYGEEYGVRESWTKLLSIPYLDDPGLLQYSVPYCIADNGEVLLEFKGLLIIYNPKDGAFRHPVINGACQWIEAEIYIETLVSPKVGNCNLETTGMLANTEK
ncbi:hypothetical protein GH714_019295 [Hevea brasiliensis]|uniref:F-box domain-containing protein n=1 Tax=Hevea brasiliensis TaxID=3981 RepID=A0A6A6MBL6_HEVBR|nr:hypothetical protein GH714_019295 [Hevea brasiliensis]